MKIIQLLQRFGRRLRRFALLTGIIVVAVPAIAQTRSAVPGSQVARTTFEQDEIFSEAVKLALAEDIVGAEQWLAVGITAKAGTAGWHQQMAHRLVRLARGIYEYGRAQPVRLTAARAVQHFRLVEKLSTESRVRSSAMSSAGRLASEYLGDRESAKAFYRTALAINPASKHASDALAKIERAERRKLSHRPPAP